MKAIPTTPASPWRQPMVWLVVSGPAAVVVASFFTLGLAIRHPDPPLELRHSAAQAADEVADLRAREGDPVPALVARNHAATGTAGLKK
ncbi:MAG TPA: hypothetical protein VIN03_28950 [Roseateles sp.]